MRICFDIDDTLTVKCGEDYTIDSLPDEAMISLVNSLYDKGHNIILYTARKMQSNGHNVGSAVAKSGYNTFKWLEKYGVKYHEIFFGKPNADLYIDDKAAEYYRPVILAILEDILNDS